MPPKKSIPRDTSSLLKSVLKNNARNTQKQNIISKIQDLNNDITHYKGVIDKLIQEQNKIQKKLAKSQNDLIKIKHKHSKLLTS